MFKCEIIADSLNPQGDRLTTFVLQFPRIVLAEFNTHRMFSRNSASSRAIPFNKMVKEVQDNPFIPIAWQKSHKGMQGTEYLDPDKKYYWSDINERLEKTFYDTFDNSDMTLKDVTELKELMNTYVWSLFKENDGLTLSEWWLKTRDLVVAASLISYAMGATKQLCNRLLEPFMWHKVIMTTSEEGLKNFFELKCPQYKVEKYNMKSPIYKSKKDLIAWWNCNGLNDVDDSHLYEKGDIDWFKCNQSQAEIHIQTIAEMMWDTYNENKPKPLKVGDWHIPFGDNINEEKTVNFTSFFDKKNIKLEDINRFYEELNNIKIKIATARCARILYNNFEEKDRLLFKIKS